MLSMNKLTEVTRTIYTAVQVSHSINIKCYIGSRATYNLAEVQISRSFHIVLHNVTQRLYMYFKQMF